MGERRLGAEGGAPCTNDIDLGVDAPPNVQTIGLNLTGADDDPEDRTVVMPGRPSPRARLVNSISRVLVNARSPARHPRRDRVSVVVDAVVTTPTGRRYAFRTINVSETGVLVAARIDQELSLKTGMVCMMRLLAPTSTVDFDAEIVRSIDDAPTAARGFAFHIVRIAPDHRAALAQMLRTGLDPVATGATKSATRRRALLVSVALVAIVVSVVGCWRSRKPLQVPVMIAARGEVAELASSSSDGENIPEQRATLRNTLSATKVDAILIKRGDRVRKGDTLIVLDEASLRNAAREARARLGVAIAQHRQARNQAIAAARQLRTEQRLAESGSAPEQSVRNRQDQLTTSNDSVVVTTAAVEDARTVVRIRDDDVTRARVIAPFDGAVADVLIHQGDTVGPSAPLIDIVNDTQLHVTAPFEESDAAKITEGMQARVSVPGVRAPITGIVQRTGTVVRSDSKGARSVLVDITLPRDVKLRSGTTANADIVLQRKEHVLTLPAHVVVRHGSTRSVFVVSREKATAREVTLGIGNADVVEIVSGLVEGDVVITDANMPGFASGVRVRVQ